MSKEKVYIVLFHRHNLKKGSRTEWEVAESVEFVNQLRNKHYTMATAIGDYLNRTMITGSRSGMGEYNKFETYIRNKYAKEMSKLDTAYGSDRIPAPENTIIVDSFGNTREKTVFDV